MGNIDTDFTAQERQLVSAAFHIIENTLDGCPMGAPDLWRKAYADARKQCSSQMQAASLLITEFNRGYKSPTGWNLRELWSYNSYCRAAIMLGGVARTCRPIEDDKKLTVINGAVAAKNAAQNRRLERINSGETNV